MGRVPFEEDVQTYLQPPGQRIWEAIEDSPDAMKALERGKKGPSRRAALQTYLTTPKTLEQLIPIAEVREAETVRRKLLRGMVLVHAYLPEEIRQEYPTPKAALRARSREGMKIRTRTLRDGTYSGKQLGRPRNTTQ